MEVILFIFSVVPEDKELWLVGGRFEPINEKPKHEYILLIFLGTETPVL